jgi:transposase
MQEAQPTYVPLEKYEALEQRCIQVEYELDKLKRLIFGAKSERFVPTEDIPGQLLLELEGLEPVAQVHKKMVAAHERSQREEPSKHQGRLPIPQHFDRVVELVEPEEDTTGMKHIGDLVTEVLEYQPGKIWVRQIVRRKYVRNANMDSEPSPEESTTSEVIVAPMPDQAFPRLKAGVSLLVYLLIGKFADHLPLYRMNQILARQGLKIPESTLGEWVKVAIERLEVLYEAQKRRLLRSAYLQIDETTIQVLEESKKGKAHLGYIWVLYDPVNKLPYYTYLPGRSHHGPKALLATFCGYLQSDGFSVYELLNKIMPDITLVNCLAHARREFFNAKSNDLERATVALEMIKALYKVEEEARNLQLDAEERLALRLKKSKPVWEVFHTWLKTELEKGLPKSPITGAIGYTLKRWENLGRFLEDGKLEIDNNLVENAIRPIAIGRKNYLFAGNHEAAQRNAMMYTFITSCKHCGIDPSVWLQDVLGRLHRQPINKIDDLLPQNWKNPHGTGE